MKESPRERETETDRQTDRQTESIRMREGAGQGATCKMTRHNGRRRPHTPERLNPAIAPPGRQRHLAGGSRLTAELRARPVPRASQRSTTAQSLAFIFLISVSRSHIFDLSLPLSYFNLYFNLSLPLSYF